MINKSKRILGLMLVAGAFAVIGGENLRAQSRDPFSKPGWAAPRTGSSSSPSPSPGNPSGAPIVKVKPVPAPVVPIGAPPVQERLNYFLRLRETAANSGQQIPKPTLVMTMDELTVTGIFKTPRGYAASVQALPINLSYTIYPGEKVFDAQLVAIEENKLVFRKVTKMSNGKFVASEQSKAMRQYSQDEVVQGTAPVEQSARTESANNTAAPPPAPSADPNVKPAIPGVIISPVDEMNRQPVEMPKAAKGKPNGKSSPARKPVRVASSKNR